MLRVTHISYMWVTMSNPIGQKMSYLFIFPDLPLHDMIQGEKVNLIRLKATTNNRQIKWVPKKKRKIAIDISPPHSSA